MRSAQHGLFPSKHHHYFFKKDKRAIYHQEFDFQATNWLVSVQRPIQRRDWLTVRSDVAIICITLGSAELIGCK